MFKFLFLFILICSYGFGQSTDPFANFRSNEGTPVLHEAIDKKDLNKIKELIILGANLSEKDVHGISAIEKIFNVSNENFVLFVLENTPSLLKINEDLKLKIFAKSLEKNWLQVLNYKNESESLFSHKLYFKKYKGEFLIDSLRVSNKALFLKLLADFNYLNEGNYNPYCTTIYNDDNETLISLLNDKIIPANNCGIHNQSPLQLAIAFNKSDEIIAKLIGITPLLHAKDNLGNTAISTALHRSQENIIRMLLNQKRFLELPDRELKDLIEKALNHTEYTIFEDIISRIFEKPNDEIKTLAFIGKLANESLNRFQEDERFFKYLLSTYSDMDKKEKDNSLAAALVKAVELENTFAVRLLFEENVNPNKAFDLLGFAVLHKAVSQGNYNLVKLIVQNNADVNLLTKDKRHALALADSNKRIVSYLIDEGAKITINSHWISDDPKISKNDYEFDGLDKKLAPVKFHDFTPKLNLEVKPALSDAIIEIEIEDLINAGNIYKFEKRVEFKNGSAKLRFDSEDIKQNLKVKKNSSAFLAKIKLKLGSSEYDYQSKNLLFPIQVNPIVYLPNGISRDKDDEIDELKDFFEDLNPNISINGDDLTLYPFFVWDYDWKKDIEQEFNKFWLPSGSFLKLVQEMKKKSGIASIYEPKFIFIGEGQGGLLLNRLIVDSKYSDYVKQAIFYQTPFFGSPAVTLALSKEEVSIDNIKLSRMDLEERRKTQSLKYLSPSDSYPKKFKDENMPLNNLKTKKIKSFEIYLQGPLKVDEDLITNIVVEQKEPQAPGFIHFNPERKLATGFSPTKGNHWVPIESQKGRFTSSQIVEIKRTSASNALQNKVFLNKLSQKILD